MREDRGGVQKTTFFVVRHGESVANREGRFTRSDDEPLTELGLSQARATGRRLLSQVQFNAAYSSPYRRALETAREIIGARETFGASDLELRIEPEIREQSFGRLAGAAYAEYYPQIAEATNEERWRHCPPGGESLQAVRNRVARVFDRLVADHPSELVLVVCHGAVMAALRGIVSGGYPQPQSTGNADGFRVTYSPGVGLQGPLPLLVTES